MTIKLQFLPNGKSGVNLVCCWFYAQDMLMQAEDLQKLVSWTMPYGKYQGRVLADLPGHYLGWFARAGFPKGELGALLALMYELDHNDLRGLLQPLRPVAQVRSKD